MATSKLQNVQHFCSANSLRFLSDSECFKLKILPLNEQAYIDTRRSMTRHVGVGGAYSSPCDATRRQRTVLTKQLRQRSAIFAASADSAPSA